MKYVPIDVDVVWDGGCTVRTVLGGLVMVDGVGSRGG